MNPIVITSRSIRCYLIPVQRRAALTGSFVWATRSEGWAGHELITCSKCGELMGIESDYKLYNPAGFHEDLVRSRCARCGAAMADVMRIYPEYYLADDGEIIHDPDLMFCEVQHFERRWIELETFCFESRPSSDG